MPVRDRGCLSSADNEEAMKQSLCRSAGPEGHGRLCRRQDRGLCHRRRRHRLCGHRQWRRRRFQRRDAVLLHRAHDV